MNFPKFSGNSVLSAKLCGPVCMRLEMREQLMVAKTKTFRVAQWIFSPLSTAYALRGRNQRMQWPRADEGTSAMQVLHLVGGFFVDVAEDCDNHASTQEPIHPARMIRDCIIRSRRFSIPSFLINWRLWEHEGSVVCRAFLWPYEKEANSWMRRVWRESQIKLRSSDDSKANS